MKSNEKCANKRRPNCALHSICPEEHSVKNPAKLDLDNYLPYLVNRVGTIIADQYGGEALAPYRLEHCRCGG